MLQETTTQGIKIFPLIIGIIAILLALFGDRPLRGIGLKPLSEGFTNPRFQQSARTTQWLGRLFLALFGVGFLVEGAGALLFTAEVVSLLSTILLGLAVLLVLAMLIVVIINWKG